MDVRKPAFSFGWNPVETSSTITKDNYLRLREWQEECFNELKSASHWLQNCPMGSGKSFEIQCLIAYELKKNKDFTAIIAVPQTIIASAFQKLVNIEFPNGRRFDWFSNHDLCCESSESSIQHLCGFLENPKSKTFWQDRVAICSHATLVRAFKQSPELFQNVRIVIDEAHHIKHGEIIGLDVEMSNGIGSVAAHALVNPDLNIKIGLATATFFRGDMNSIVPLKYLPEFKKFLLPYDKYLATCKYIKGFKFDFLLYQENYEETIRELFSEDIGKTIVYIPYVNSRYSLGSKNYDVEAIFRAISGEENCLIKDFDQPVMRVKRGDGWVRVVNLVDEKLRDEKKIVIEQDHESDQSQIDVIITLGMFKEGANWRWADREIIIGQRNSLTEIIQIVGRLLRDAPQKEYVRTFQLLKFSFDQLNRVALREDLNDFLKAIIASMALEQIMNPVPINLRNGENNGEERQNRINYLLEETSDETEATRIQQEIYNRAIFFMGENQEFIEPGGIAGFREEFNQIVSSVLTENKIEEFHEEIARQIWMAWQRRTLQLKGIDVSQIDLDLVEENPLGFLLGYTSQLCGIQTFNQLRRLIYGNDFLSFKEARKLVRSYNLNSRTKYLEFIRNKGKDLGLPINPQSTYKDSGWIDWYDYLGKDKTEFLSFKEARKLVRSYSFNSIIEYKKFARHDGKELGLPINPHIVYKDSGWIDWYDYLGKDKTEFLSFKEARKLVRSYNFKSSVEYKKFAIYDGKELGLPLNPQSTYKYCGWNGWLDFLGKTGFLSFKEARKLVRSYNFNLVKEYLEFIRNKGKDLGLPMCPHITYKDKGWNGWNDYLGRGESRFLSFKEARKLVRSYNFNSIIEYKKFVRNDGKKLGLPYTPDVVYKDKGWIDWYDYFGKIGFLSFKEARKLVRSYNFNSVTKYQEFVRNEGKELRLPVNPHAAYKNKGWINWLDYFGKIGFLSFKEARQLVRSYNFKSSAEYQEFARNEGKELRLSVNPNLAYKNKGWIDWYDYLGNERPAK